jgi:hypothetical protein
MTGPAFTTTMTKTTTGAISAASETTSSTYPAGYGCRKSSRPPAWAAEGTARS